MDQFLEFLELVSHSYAFLLAGLMINVSMLVCWLITGYFFFRDRKRLSILFNPESLFRKYLIVNLKAWVIITIIFEITN